ncbi:MAG: FAD-dependent oxidoreductase [Phycisphaerales bacterium]
MSVPHWLRNDARVIEDRGWVVIGAGITGLSAALALQDAGEDVLVLERDVVGRRASTRNAGFLMRGAAENYFLASERYGRELTNKLWRRTEKNLEGLRELGVETLPSFRACPSCLLAFEDGELEEIQRSYEMMRADGFETEWINTGTDAVWTHASPLGGLVNPNDAVCNPAELIGLLRERFEGMIREQTPVGEVRHANDVIELCVPGGIIRAGCVIVCTNAYSRGLGEAMPDVRPNRGQMIALRVDEHELDLAYYSDRGSEYFRQADERTVVVGGRRKYREEEEKTTSEAPTAALQRELEEFAESILGHRYPVVARWAGTMGFTGDGLPIVRAVDEGERVWFVGGMNGHGMSMAYRTARLAVDHMMGRGENPFPDREAAPREDAAKG